MGEGDVHLRSDVYKTKDELVLRAGGKFERTSQVRPECRSTGIVATTRSVSAVIM